MNINYNTADGTIEIKDGMRMTYNVLKILMVINIFNASISYYNAPANGKGFLEILWICVGVLSLGVLFFLIFRKSTARVLPVGNIIRLKEKRLFGKRHFAFVLKGGKTRDLGKLKEQADIDSLLVILSQAGIPTPSRD